MNQSNRVDLRKLKVKWHGWSSREEDLSWEPQANLIEDGHEELVASYLLAHKLKFPQGLEVPSQSNDGSEGVGDETEAPPIRVPQPPIAHMLTVLHCQQC